MRTHCRWVSRCRAGTACRWCCSGQPCLCLAGTAGTLPAQGRAGRCWAGSGAGGGGGRTPRAGMCARGWALARLCPHHAPPSLTHPPAAATRAGAGCGHLTHAAGAAVGGLRADVRLQARIPRAIRSLRVCPPRRAGRALCRARLHLGLVAGRARVAERPAQRGGPGTRRVEGGAPPGERPRAAGACTAPPTHPRTHPPTHAPTHPR